MERFGDSWASDPFGHKNADDGSFPSTGFVAPAHHNDSQVSLTTPSKSYHARREQEPDTLKLKKPHVSSHRRNFTGLPPTRHENALPESDFKPQARPPDFVDTSKQRTTTSKDDTMPRTVTPYERIKMRILSEDVFSRFCEEQLKPDDSIWDLVILTGRQSNKIELEHGLACTIGQYIGQAWPSSRHEIRELFHTVCPGHYKSVRQCHFIRCQYGDAHLRSYDLGNGTVELTFSGASGTIEPLVEALQWLSAVLQPVRNRTGPVTSTTRLILDAGSKKTGGGDSYRAEVNSAQSLRVPQDSSCWTKLFPNTPCATGFPAQAKPKFMHGIEISFDLMCLLSGVEYEVSEQDGLVLYGRHTMLYPVSQYEDCVQWHLETLNRCGSTQRHRAMRKTNFQDLEALTDKRSFLGMWDNAAVLLGTDSYSNDQLTALGWSSAAEVTKETHRSGWSFGGSIGLPKALSLSLTQNFVVANSRRPQSLVDFEANFDRMVQTPVMLYCPSEKRAWLVSYTSVALHLARVRAAVQSRQLGYAIPACDEDNDGGRAAFDLVHSYHHLPIKVPAPGRALSSIEKEYTIGHYINEVMSAMDTARRESCLASDALAPFRNKLLGFELADIGHLRSRMKLKQHNLDALASGCWAPLLDEVEYLFFCEGLGDPIVPSRLPDQEDTCARTIWHTTPEGYNLLTASLPVLIDLGREYNTRTIDRLTSRYDWDSQRVFGSCHRSNRHFCSRLQSVARKDRGRSPRISTDYRRGAVVFRYVHDVSTIRADLRRIRSRKHQSTNRPPSRVRTGSTRPEAGYDSGYDTESQRPGGSRRESRSDGSAGPRGRPSDETIRTGRTPTTGSSMSPRPPHRSESQSFDVRSGRLPNSHVEHSRIPTRVRGTPVSVRRPPRVKVRSSWRRLFDFRNVESGLR